MLKFCPLFSSSSGNSVYIGDNSGGILIDVGRSAKQTCLMLNEIGVEPSSLKGIFITHEHTDHINGLNVFAKKHNIPVYASTGTLEALKSKGILTDKHIDIAINGETTIADMNIKPLKTSHDCADGCGYLVTGCDGTTRIAVVTDTGYMPHDILSEITGSKLIYIESNHDVNMLKSGSYPFALQKRILSDIGHLSNDTCADTLCSLVNKGSTHFVLAHLSRENNTPELAYNTSVNALRQVGALENRDFIIKVAEPENSNKPILL